MATHSSILAWKIPWTEEPGKLQSTGSQESDTTERPKTHSTQCISGRECHYSFECNMCMGADNFVFSLGVEKESNSSCKNYSYLFFLQILLKNFVTPLSNFFYLIVQSQVRQMVGKLIQNMEREASY